MKLKFKQRVALKILQTKIKCINLLSKEKAALSLFNTFCTPYSGKQKREKPLIFKKAEGVFVTYNAWRINGWHFNRSQNNGKKVIVIHGFDSCAYKSEAIITSLIENKFEVLAFDALGHGTSDGSTINAKQYAEILSLIVEKYGEAYAFVAHSLGGLAASLAIENKVKVDKLVLIAPATETSRAIDNFFQFLKMPSHLKKEIEKLILKISGHPASHFSVKRIIQVIHTPTLWVHDENDFICPIHDVYPVKDLNLQHVTFYFTKNMGHNFIYRNKEVLHKVNDFLK